MSAEATLKELGISRDQSSQWQRLAAIPAREFEAALGSSDIPTTKGIIRNFVEPERRKSKVASEALWLWGRLAGGGD
jgi:hypothetical protein